MPVTLVLVHISPVYLLGTMHTRRDICISEYIYIYIYYVCEYIYIYIIDMCKYIYSHVIFSAWFIVCSNSVHKVPLANRLLTPISCFPLEVYLLKSWVTYPVHLPLPLLVAH